MATYTIEQLEKKVETMISDVRSGFGSQYLNFETESDDSWTIRVSNHRANPARVSDNTIIFVVDVPKEESEEYTSWGINEKTFADVKNQIKLDDDNCNEWGEDIESILEDLLK